MNQKSSKQLINEFQDTVDQKYISINHKLSEDFIIKFKDKINWKHTNE